MNLGEEIALNNIVEVVSDGLCTGCGTCAGVCPTDAIAMRVSNGLFLPEVNVEKCTRCGLCLEYCSGHSVDFEELNSEIFGKQPKDHFLGNYLKCYIGHSNDDWIRFNSSSGGIATQLLLFALEKGLVDKALVTRMRKDNPLEPEPFIARTREEIISASKSKYCPVPLNAALKEIINADGRFAIVGLPCHIHGVRRAEMVSKELRDRITLHVGLFCSHTVNFTGTDFLLMRFGVRKNDVVKLDYRGKGLPGSMSIQLKDGRNLSVRFIRGWKAYWNVFSSFFFTPLRCMMCPDQSNELADVSVGDAWLPELKRARLGESVLVARTPIAEEMLALMKKRRVLLLRVVSPSKVKESQAFSLNFKKQHLAGRLSFLRMLGYITPDISPIGDSSGFLTFLDAVFSYFSFYVSSSKFLRSLLIYFPLPLFRLYFGVFKCISLLSKRRG